MHRYEKTRRRQQACREWHVLKQRFSSDSLTIFKTLQKLQTNETVIKFKTLIITRTFKLLIENYQKIYSRITLT